MIAKDNIELKNKVNSAKSSIAALDDRFYWFKEKIT